MKNNLLKRLKRKVLPALVGVMGLASVYGCDGGPTKPIPPPPTNQSPIAEFAVSPNTGYAPLTTNFNGSSSRDPDGSVVKYVWEFGDGNTDSNSGTNAQHIYTSQGNYNSCLTVEDNKGARSSQTCKQVSVNSAPQTRISGYLEDVLTGQRILGLETACGTSTAKDTTDSNGSFSLPSENCNNLTVNSSQYYNLSMPVTPSSNQDTNLGNVQMIKRYVDPVTGEDLLEFMKKYMLPSRWDDADLPIKVWIDNNPPSAEYREAVRQGIMSWDAAVNAWLPADRKLTMAQIVNADPAVGIRVDYNPANTSGSFEFVESFKKGLLKMNPAQVPNAAVRTSAHELEHGIFGPKLSPFDHSPYSNHLLSGGLIQVLPSSFEGLVVATKYKLKKDAVGLYSK